MRDNDITKLPKWAQNEISRLNANVEYFKEQVRSTEHEDTDTRIRHWEEPNQHLPNGARVEFKDKDGEWITVYVDSDGRVQVMSGSSHYLAVYPRSANGVQLVNVKDLS